MKPRHYLLPTLVLLAGLIGGLYALDRVLDHIARGGTLWAAAWLLAPGAVMLASIALTARADRVAERARWRTHQQEERARARTAKRRDDASLTELAEALQPDKWNEREARRDGYPSGGRP